MKLSAAIALLALLGSVHANAQSSAPPDKPMVGMGGLAAFSEQGASYGLGFDMVDFPIGIGFEVTTDAVEGYQATCTLRKNTVAGPGLSSLIGAGAGVLSNNGSSVYLAGAVGLRAVSNKGIGFILAGRLEYYVQGDAFVRPVATVTLGLWL